MKEIVIDASALVEMLLHRAGSPVSARVRGARLIAPSIVVPEAINAIRRLLRKRRIDEVQADRMMRGLIATPLRTRDPGRFASRIWGYRDRLSAMDACYLVLAEVVSAPIITCDGGLADVAGERAELFAVG